MKTIFFNQYSIYDGTLILVNPEYPLQSSGQKELVPASPDYPDILLRRDAADVLQIILKKLSAEKQIIPVSGYRSGEEQTKLYHDSLIENGADFTKKFVAWPGHSEHQTGLAIDLGLYSDHIDFIRPDFPYDGICEAFRKAAPGYGFIERYPAGKETITGITHEPWHFRYVGVPHAELMANRSLTLEEYSDFLKTCTREHPLSFQGFQIYYVPASEASAPIFLPEDADYQISGNNIDGFFVTVRRQNG